MGELTFAPIKTQRILYTQAEIQTMRRAAAADGVLPEPLRDRPLNPAARRDLDATIWRHVVMPLNANPGQIYGPMGRGSDALKQVHKEAEAQLGHPIGHWSWRGSRWRYDQPWVLENKTLGLTYSRLDHDADRVLPAPWPFAEDKGGYFYTVETESGVSGFNQGMIPRAMQRGYHTVLGALGATPQSRIAADQFDLPKRYLLLGDQNAAEDASFLLAAYAYHYPGYDWNAHCMVNIIDVNRTFHSGNVRGRGCSYQGWSTGEVIGVIRAYDALFPYIQGNQQLADRIGRFVPWVKTPDDVVKRIDTFLVQRAAHDGLRHTLYNGVVPVAAATLGPSDVADRYLDDDVYRGEVYMKDNQVAFVDGLTNATSRDGLTFIGSTFYVVGGSVGKLTDVIAPLRAQVRAGGTLLAAQVDGKQVDLQRTTEIYRGGAAYIDPVGKFIELDNKSTLASYHPDYCDGLTAYNERGQVLGRARLVLGDRYWYTGWPEARRHRARIDPEDLTDADGDGRVTLDLLVSEHQKAMRFAEDGQTVETLEPGEKMLTLNVSRLAEDGYLLHTEQHPREYLDAVKVPLLPRAGAEIRYPRASLSPI